MKFLHASCFSPVKSTWIKAIRNGNFATFPGLIANLVSKYLPLEILTILGHYHRFKQGIWPTIAQIANARLMLEPLVQKVCIKVLELPHLICMDQTRKFPIQSRTGNNYLMTLCLKHASAQSWYVAINIFCHMQTPYLLILLVITFVLAISVYTSVRMH